MLCGIVGGSSVGFLIWFGMSTPLDLPVGMAPSGGYGGCLVSPELFVKKCPSIYIDRLVALFWVFLGLWWIIVVWGTRGWLL
jgi:hypothetical protein